jgi:hypothetical protein
MEPEKSDYKAWCRSLSSGSNECCASGPTPNRKVQDGPSRMDIVRFLGAFNYENISKAAKETSATDLPTPRIIMYLCHSNAMLEQFNKAGFHGHFENRKEYFNKFLENYRSISDLREATFSDTDSHFYCMTYGQGSKLLRHINVDVSKRVGLGQVSTGMRICMATHVVLEDSWNTTIEVSTFMLTYDALLSYGCLMPRMIHLSTGPKLSPMPNSLNASGIRSGDVIWCHWIEDVDLTVRVDIDKTLCAVNSHLSEMSRQKNLPGYIYVVLPDMKSFNVIDHARSEDAVRFGNNLILANKSMPPFDGTISVVCVLYDIAKTLDFVDPVQLIIVPYARRHKKYVPLTKDSIPMLISKLSRFSYGPTMSVPLSAVLVSVPVLNKLEGSLRVLSVNSLNSAYPQDVRKNLRKFLETCTSDEQERFVCQMAETSIQTGSIIPDAVTNAAKKGLVLSVIVDSVPKVTQLNSTGLFLSRANVSTFIMNFFKAWQKVPHIIFPAYCLASILERYERGLNPLIDASADDIKRISNEREYTDPLVHQLHVVVEYIRKYGLVIVSKIQIDSFVSIYGANAEALVSIIARISAFRSSGLSSDLRYGPFDPYKLTSILDRYKIFPIARYVAPLQDQLEPAYVIHEHPMRYMIPHTSPYPICTDLLVLYSESSQNRTIYTKNAISSTNLVLYAALQRNVH